MTTSSSSTSSTTTRPSSSFSSFHVSPTFDLDSYIARYEPHSETRLKRLLHIAKQCSKFVSESDVAYELVLSAYTQIAKQLKHNLDTRRYVLIFAPASTADESVAMNAAIFLSSSSSKTSELLLFDIPFVTQTEVALQGELQTLEGCLTQAQAHLAKDSIRICHFNLIEFYKIRGDLNSALKYAFRTRDYCTHIQSSIQIHFILIELLLHTGNSNQVLEFVAKTELLVKDYMTTSTSSSSSAAAAGSVDPTHSMETGHVMTETCLDEFTLLLSKLTSVSAIVHMEQGRFSEALANFLKLDGRFTNHYNTIISAEDITLYGGLLALATTTSRKELYIQMLDSNSTYKERLELVPVLRDAIQHYTRSEYRPCLERLYSLQPELDLDLHFHTHVHSLFELIRNKCLIQYFSPYSVVSFQTLADCVGVHSAQDIELIIANLILSGKWKGVRINCSTQTLHAVSSIELDRRRKRNTYQKVLQMGESFMTETQNTLLRLSCIENGLIIKDESAGSNKKGGGYMSHYGGGGGGSLQDDLIASYIGTYGDSRARSWYDEATSHHRVEIEGDDDEEEEDVVMMDRRF